MRVPPCFDFRLHLRDHREIPIHFLRFQGLVLFREFWLGGSCKLGGLRNWVSCWLSRCAGGTRRVGTVADKRLWKVVFGAFRRCREAFWLRLLRFLLQSCHYANH